MAVKIEIQRHGSKKRPFYFIVVADARSPRDGKFIQKLGTYNPLTVPATIQLIVKKHWTGCTKVPSLPILFAVFLCFKGVLYLKHLLRGVTLGLFDEATAMEKFRNGIQSMKLRLANARKKLNVKEEADAPMEVAVVAVVRKEELKVVVNHNWFFQKKLKASTVGGCLFILKNFSQNFIPVV